MELDEMKTLWADVSLRMEKQDKIQKELLIDITRQKFRNKLDYVRIPEIIGALFCVGYAMYVLSHFSDFELWYNQLFALISVFILLALPVASLSVIKGMRTLRIDSESPAAILDKFTKNKIRFEKVQRHSMIFGGILMITILPPLAELRGSVAKISNPLFWIIYIPICLGLMFFLSRWVLKKYKRVIDSSEKMLKELEY
ncbi:hypothetical protein J2X69_000125 [Algoriphagus sp. 4150]|uniref:hypothetical protein n=1 Tax=Algoriphagus sp. 4150 TaxID=2817756 RepID=UPI002866B252|nr:hypothetical protein [Algoriphagus sp. 4150]MDR7127797.1 hypothetical protein [Algoriphagus sp. 4150]